MQGSTDLSIADGSTDGGSGLTGAVALPAVGGAVGAAGWPAAGGAAPGVPVTAAPGGFAGDGGVAAVVPSEAVGLVGGAD